LISSVEQQYVTNVTPCIYANNIFKKSILIPQKLPPHFQDQTDYVVSDGQTFVLRSIREVENT